MNIYYAKRKHNHMISPPINEGNPPSNRESLTDKSL